MVVSLPDEPYSQILRVWCCEREGGGGCQGGASVSERTPESLLGAVGAHLIVSKEPIAQRARPL